MPSRLDEIAAYQREYWGASLFDCIMAVADVSDLDNDELDALEREVMALQTSPKQGNNAGEYV